MSKEISIPIGSKVLKIEFRTPVYRTGDQTTSRVETSQEKNQDQADSPTKKT